MFEFNSVYDSELFQSVSRLEKTNNGYFKSPNQRDFFKKLAIGNFNYLNFKVQSNQFVFCIAATARFADYGIRSYRRVEWLVVCDDVGIVRKEKVLFKYLDGMSYASGDYQLVWERDCSIPAPVFEVKPVVEKKWIGVIGQRVHLKGLVKIARHIGYNAYGDSKYQTVVETEDGGTLVYWNLISLKMSDGSKHSAQAGDVVEFDAGVKDHDTFRDIPQTMITRVTKAKRIQG
jgi:hypothetical protein